MFTFGCMFPPVLSWCCLTDRRRNLVGFAASTDARMRLYFIAEVVRCAFSYGCYQMEVFQGAFFSFFVLRCLLGASDERMYTN